MLLPLLLPLLTLTLLPSALTLTTSPPPPYYPTNTTSTNGTITPPSRYYLRTQVKGPETDKNGLYVSSYHTGAGENDATLESIDVASVGYLNGSNQQFDLGTAFPWGVGIEVTDEYAGIYSFSIFCCFFGFFALVVVGLGGGC